MTEKLAADDRRGMLQRALHALDEMQARLEAAEAAKHAPIAIIGMSCRFPGANDVDSLWRNLAAGVDSVGPPPPGRWPGAGADDPRYRAGYVSGIDEFDPQFFGISPREARTMDPQQRMLLEGAWTALEDAGLPPDALVSSTTGVFVGITASEYGKLTQSIDAGTDVYVATGAALNAASGRLSFVLGLQGPCVAVDSACSSSLVAVHLACQSLRSGESSLALACGVNALLSPDPFDLFARWGMLAPDARCKTFDESANGFVRGEGCGVVVLKRLADALAAGDRVLAVIRGSASNQDGRSSALSVPNGLAQERVIRTALANGKVRPADISYIETHGTGTVLGDPIEVGAIGAVFAKEQTEPLLVGTVKTNLGHLESASGVAGLIKTVLCLNHELIPKHLHFTKPSSRIAWDRANVRVPVEAVPWPRGARLRLAGVSSFGFTGTNAHVIVEEAPLPAQRPDAPRVVQLLPLSARDPDALADLADAYARQLESGDAELRDVSHTASAGRAHFASRVAVLADSAPASAAALRSFRSRKRDDSVIGTGAAPAEKPKIAFLFTGQGAQYRNMGRRLHEESPVFRAAFDRCDAVLAPLLGRPLASVLFGADGEPTEIDETRVSQPALFAIEYALAAVWAAWGVTPAAVLGHSVGEFAAACVAGVLDLEAACGLIAERARLMQQTPQGAMAAVFAPREQIVGALGSADRGVSIAAVNGPQSVVISASPDVLARALETLARAGIESRPLAVTRAFHSPLMESVRAPLVAAASALTHRRPAIPIVSNVTGRLVMDGGTFTPDYWGRHALEPVLFADGMQALAEFGCNCFIEIGPRETLAKLARQCLGGDGRTFAASLAGGGDDWRELLAALGRVYVAGASIAWRGVDAGVHARKRSCPTYPFRRKRYWVDVAPAREAAGGADAHRAAAHEPQRAARDTQLVGTQSAGHPLLGVRLDLAGETPRSIWQMEIDLARLPYLRDHRVQDAAVVPATAYVEMAFAAARELGGVLPLTITESINEKPMVLGEGARRVVQIALEPRGERAWSYTVHSRDASGREWIRHTSGTVGVLTAPGAQAENDESVDLDAVRRRCGERIDGAEFYRQLAAKGNGWGPCFQGVTTLWRGEGEAVARIEAPADVAAELSSYVFHPALADACGHVLVGTESLERSAGAKGGALVGGGIREARLHAAPQGREFWAVARVARAAGRENELIGEVRVFDAERRLVSETLGARLWYFDEHARPISDLFYRTEWRPRAAAPQRAPRGVWLLLGDETPLTAALADALRRAGAKVATARRGDGFRALGPGAYTVRPDSAEDLDALLDATAAEVGAPAGLVLLWPARAGWGPAPGAEPVRGDLGEVDDVDDVDDVLAAQRVGSELLALLVQRLAIRSGVPAAIWAVTRGAVDADASGVSSAAHGALWGLARSVASEHGELWGGIVDLDPAGEEAPAEADLLVAALTADDGDDCSAFRGGVRLVPRLRRHSADTPIAPVSSDATSASNAPHASDTPDAPDAPDAGGIGPRLRCSPDGAYLVTGGLGGIGLEVARRLAERGARHVVLLGRTAPPARAAWASLPADSRWKPVAETIEALEAAGTRVTVAAVDVASRSALEAAIAAVGGPRTIKGVVHAAGVMQYEPLTKQTLADMRTVLAPKVAGAWNLHTLLADAPLEFFVLFSSTAAILSSPLMGAYAAANAFLDSFAGFRRSSGLPALSISWGSWSDVGMLTRFAHAEGAAVLRGIGTIDAEEGLRALEAAMAGEASHVTVMRLNWEDWQRLYPSYVARPYLSEVRPAAHAARAGEDDADAAAVLAASPAEAMPLIRAYLQRRVAGVLELELDEVRPESTLSALGLDSLMAIELKNRIERDLRIVVPTVELLQGPSLEQLAVMVDERLPAARDAEPAAAQPAEPIELWEEGVL